MLESIAKWSKSNATPTHSLGKKHDLLRNFRVSIVNYNGVVIYDKYVMPKGRVTDYRTWVSGVRPENLLEKNGAISYDKAIKDTHRILNSCKQIVGHSL